MSRDRLAELAHARGVWFMSGGSCGFSADRCSRCRPSGAFSNQRDAFSAAGVIGVADVSTQQPPVLKAAAVRHSLTFPLLSDRDALLADALRLPTIDHAGHVMHARSTLVAVAGRILWVFHPVADPAGHPTEVLAWVRRRTGRV